METFSGRGFLFSFRIYIIASMILLRGSGSNYVEVLLTPIAICPLACLKIAFPEMCVTVCGRFVSNLRGAAGYVD